MHTHFEHRADPGSSRRNGYAHTRTHTHAHTFGDGADRGSLQPLQFVPWRWPPTHARTPTHKRTHTPPIYTFTHTYTHPRTPSGTGQTVDLFSHSGSSRSDGHPHTHAHPPTNAHTHKRAHTPHTHPPTHTRTHLRGRGRPWISSSTPVRPVAMATASDCSVSSGSAGSDRSAL